MSTPTTPTFGFARNFQIGILGLTCQKYDFLVTVADLIKPEFFEDKVLGWFFRTIRDYFLDYHLSPTQDVLREEIRKAYKAKHFKDTDEVKAHMQVFLQLWNPVDAQEYLIAQVVQFCRRQAIRRAFLECAPKIDTADDDTWNEIQGQVTDACSVGSNSLDIGMQYFEHYQERLHKRLLGDTAKPVPAGIQELDILLGGGLKPGQVGIWMGGTGVGKSIVLPHCGRRAVVEGLKVVHYTLELNEEDIGDRYDSAWSSVPINSLASKKHYPIVEKQISKLGKTWGNSLIIKFYPTRQATIGTIRAHLRQLHGLGFIPGAVVVDYVDLIKPTTNYQDEYADLGAITADLRGIAGELSIPIWTATQTNRAGLNKEIVDLKDISDSLKKAQIADIVIGICMTPEERDMNKARLHIAKNRNGPTGKEVEIHTAYDRMCFYRQIPAVQHKTGVTRRSGRVAGATT